MQTHREKWGFILECSAVVRTHYPLWAWLWNRRLHGHLDELISPLVAFA